MDRRTTMTRAGTTLAKLVFGLTIFGSTVGGWAYLRPAVINRMPLPDSVSADASNACALWFIGSSSIVRWASMQRDIPGWQVHNRGIDGARLPQIEARAMRTTSHAPPAGIVLYAGENDIVSGRSAPDTAGIMMRLVGELSQRWPSVPIFIIGLKASPERWSQRPEQLRYDIIIRAFAARRPGVYYVPAGALLLRDGLPDPRLYVDGVHLNERGYALWSRDVRSGIDAAMPQDRAARCTRPVRLTS